MTDKTESQTNRGTMAKNPTNSHASGEIETQTDEAQTEPKPTFSVEEAKEYLARPAARGIIWSFIAAVAGGYGLFRNVASLDDQILFLGAIASIFALIAYTRIIPEYGGLRVGELLPQLVNLGMLVPTAFAAFLIVYQGLWTARIVLQQFDVWLIIRSAFWIFAGFKLERQAMIMTNFSSAMIDNRISVNQDSD